MLRHSELGKGLYWLAFVCLVRTLSPSVHFSLMTTTKITVRGLPLFHSSPLSKTPWILSYYECPRCPWVILPCQRTSINSRPSVFGRLAASRFSLTRFIFTGSTRSYVYFSESWNMPRLIWNFERNLCSSYTQVTSSLPSKLRKENASYLDIPPSVSFRWQFRTNEFEGSSISPHRTRPSLLRYSQYYHFLFMKSMQRYGVSSPELSSSIMRNVHFFYNGLSSRDQRVSFVRKPLGVLSIKSIT